MVQCTVKRYSIIYGAVYKWMFPIRKAGMITPGQLPVA